MSSETLPSGENAPLPAAPGSAAVAADAVVAGIDRESLPRLGADPAFLGMTVTQFLGAFNDNVFKQLVLLICVNYAALRAGGGDPYSAVATGVFALSFILFSGTGGYLADRFSKRTIIIGCKIAEIVVMAAGLIAFFLFPPETLGRIIVLDVVLFLMGMQSAIFGPAKYGILPEMLRDRDLPNANGFIQMTTFIAIIVGTAIAGFAKESFAADLWVVSGICILIAVTGTATAFLLRGSPASRPDLKYSFSFAFISRETWRLMRSDTLLLRVLLIAAIFWFVGGVVLPTANAIGKFQYGLDDEARISLLAAAMGIGIAFGCATAGLLSKKRIRFGLVRVGAVGISVCFVLIWLMANANLVSSVTYWLTFAGLIGVGFFGGLFAVPLQVFLQARPPAGQKGRMIAAMNLCTWVGIILASGVYYLCSLLGKVAVIGSAWPSVTFLLLAGVMLPVAVLFRTPDQILG